MYINVVTIKLLAIALSNCITKILEVLLYSFIESRDVADEYQFGFRKNHSTALCTHVFKKNVNCYRENGSHVFACFVDFNKAFDNVDYWLLFRKLIVNDTSVKCYAATRLFAYWTGTVTSRCCLPTGTVVSRCLFAGRTCYRSFLMLRMV